MLPPRSLAPVDPTFSDARPASLRRVRRVLIVDEHPVVRYGLRRVVEREEDLMVCGEAASMNDVAAAIEALRPDVLVADVSAPDGDPVERMRALRLGHPALPILVLSNLDETIFAQRLLSVGANGYIMKEAPSAELLGSLRRVLDGNSYVSATVATTMMRSLRDGASCRSADPFDRLTNRELEILSMIGKGMSTRETAQHLHLSIKTVESHRQRMKRKLNLDSGPQLVRYALLGLGKSGRSAAFDPARPS